MGSYFGSYKRSQLERMLSTSIGRSKETEEVYHCCGQKFTGLHALTEHIEDNPNDHQDDPEAHNDGGMFSPLVMGMDLDLETDPYNVPSTTNSARSSTSPRPVPNSPRPPPASTGPRPEAPSSNDSNAANGLKLSEWLKSPANTDASALPGAPGIDGSNVVDLSSGVPKFASAVRGGFHGGMAAGGRQRFDRAFNEVVAGRAGLEDPNKPPGPIAVAPSVLFTKVPAMGLPQASAVVGRREGTAGNGTPAAAPAAAPAPATGAAPAKDAASTSATAPATPAAAEVKKEGEESPAKPDVAPATTEGPPPPPPGAAGKAPDASRAADTPLPPPSLFTTHKAWRCPNPGCNKAYKQSNGLKYHLAKGQCDFAIHDAIDNGLTLEEAEQRARPYVCAVGAGCDKRYRQMNGLKYHYLNTGEHGKYGLRMLANGTHPQPVHHPPMPKRDRSQQPRNNGAPVPNANARAGAAPYNVPQRPTASNPTPNGAPNGVVANGVPNAAAPKPAAAPTGPRMGTWPVPQRAGVPPPTTGPGGPPATRPAAPAVTPVTAASKAPASKMPVQRGRDAVLFSNVDLLDV
jgi:transcription factor SFP1